MTTAETPAVAFRGVGKRFAHWVLRDVDMTLPAGRTSALVGPSGCGKTTALQLVNGVYRAEQGDIAVFGEPVPEADIHAFRRHIGYAVQGAGLFPHMTVAENAGLLARLERWEADASPSGSASCSSWWGLRRRWTTATRTRSPAASNSARAFAGR